MHDVAILIPAYNPDQTLIEVLEGLRACGFTRIVVVDDGSLPECLPVLQAAAAHAEVLVHAVNCGKGRALKTGFNHLATQPGEGLRGVVTVDADGQHRPADVVKVAAALREAPGKSLVIGQRQFATDVPLRSLVGNMATRYVFYFLVGRLLNDTQSGLRGLPLAIVPELIRLSGEGYDYEMNMLVHTKVASIPLVAVDIETVYIAKNKSSHFNPFFDSLKIYFVLLRFVSSSVLSSLIDLVIYSIFILNGASIATSLLVARVVSSFITFLLNKQYVFLKKSEFVACIAKFYLLVLFLFGMSYMMVTALNDYFGLNPILAKVLSETVLFVISFVVQRSLVFAKEDEDEHK